MDVRVTYFRIVTTVDRDLVCATTDTVASGGLRVTSDAVQFANRTYEIVQRDQRSEETAEGP